MKQKRILVVFTGGTIGSVASRGFLSPGGEQSRSLLLQQFSQDRQSFYEEKFCQQLCFDTICPYEILSENLNGRHLELLESAILEKLYDVSKHGNLAYEGIIVTTGTDTLAYLSAALGYLFSDTQIPLVTVSANYPLTDERSNGFSNFAAAVLLILEGKHSGVFCAYENKGAGISGCYIHYATRLVSQTNYSDLVWSVKDAYYAKLETDEQGMLCLKVNEALKQCERKNNYIRLCADGISRIKVALLRPYPGMRYMLPADCDAVLLDTYHSGTLPVFKSGFQEFVQEAYAKKIPVFIAGVSDDMPYETVKAYRQAGISVLPAASVPAMYVKLCLCLANGLNLEQTMPLPLGDDIF